VNPCSPRFRALDAAMGWRGYIGTLCELEAMVELKTLDYEIADAESRYDLDQLHEKLDSLYGDPDGLSPNI